MKKIKLELEVDDSFEVGYCSYCPLMYTELIDDDEWSDLMINCVLSKSYEDCPLKIVLDNIPPRGGNVAQDS